MSYAEEKARDELAFEPFPAVRWISINEKEGILICVRYSEPLSRLLRSLPNARWDAERKQWQYPFSSAAAIRRKIPEIDRLADLAQASADQETRQREAHRAEREQATQARRRDREKQRAMAQPRPLQQPYLDVIRGRPRFALAIEAIADDLRALPFGGFRSRAWVSRLFGSDGRGGWASALIHGDRDYARANSVGSRGIYIHYFLEEGPIYEVSAPQSWKSTDRYFIRIMDGNAQRMTRNEVEQCLAK